MYIYTIIYIYIYSFRYITGLLVHELMGGNPSPPPHPPPPLGNFGDLYFQKPYTLSCSDQLVCTYITGTFALEGRLKVGTSLILGVGVTFSKWGVVWKLAILWDTPNLLCWSSDQQVQLPNTFQKQRIPILGKKFKKRLKKCCFFFCSFFQKFHKL